MSSRKRPASGLYCHPRFGFNNTLRNSVRRKRRVMEENVQLVRKTRGPSKRRNQCMTLFRDSQDFSAYWDGLSVELLQSIFLYVLSQTPQGLFACRLTCRAWYRVCEHPMFWPHTMVTISNRMCSAKLYNFLVQHRITQVCSNATSAAKLNRLPAAVPNLDVFASTTYNSRYQSISEMAKSNPVWFSAVRRVVLKCTSIDGSRNAIKAIVRTLVSTISELQSLHFLHLENFYKVSLPICTVSSTLRTLTLHKCATVDLTRILGCFPNLEVLEITQSCIEGLLVVERMNGLNAAADSLRRLVLTHCTVKLEYLPAGASLSHIDLSFCHFTGDTLEELLQSIPDESLTYLDLSCIACASVRHITVLKDKFSFDSSSHLVLKQCSDVKDSDLLWLKNYNPHINATQAL